MSITPHPALSLSATSGHRLGVTTPFEEFPEEDVEQSIITRFAQQVQRYPTRLAIQTGAYHLTYEALNAAANRVARAIVSQRGSATEPVALLFDHGAEVLISLLGILKAGKFYLPLEPWHPPARLTAMLEDAQAGLIMSQAHHVALARAVAPPGCDVLTVYDIEPQTSTAELGVPMTPDLCAALLYTSGSTGRPKGVLQSHRTVLHRVLVDTNTLHIGPDDRLALLAPYSYGITLRPIFGALLNGATLCPFNVREYGAAQLAAWLRQEAITCYFSVPTVFRALVATLTEAECLPTLRSIALGGEVMTRSDVALYRTHFPPPCLLSVSLSATETGLTRQHLIDHHTPLPDDVIPVGSPVAGKEVFLLDEADAVVGHNCVGEIVVRSCYLSPGYWRQPELTQAAFRPDPAGGPARLYHTGDLGLMRLDGCLVHVGRKDLQVKIRGQLVNVESIETILRTHPAVREAVVMAREQRPGEHRLMAYVVLDQQMPPSGRALCQWMQERVPGYMVPATFIPLDTLPYTSRGKVDRQALPEAVPTISPLPYTAPRTPLEESVRQIWAEVLGVESVGVHDDFLDLGGNSLLATQIAARVRDAWCVEVSTRTLLEASTVAHMALVITEYVMHTVESANLHSLLTELEQLAEDEVQARLHAARRAGSAEQYHEHLSVEVER